MAYKSRKDFLFNWPNALFLLGVVWAMETGVLPKLEGSMAMVAFGIITAWSTYTLNSPWPIMSFKDMPRGGAALASRIFFALLSLALLIIFQVAAFAFIYAAYSLSMSLSDMSCRLFVFLMVCIFTA